MERLDPVDRRRRWLWRAGLLLAGWLAADAGWIHAKAWLAQTLLREAWAETAANGQPRRPWPWADTHPVARLSAPRLGIEQIVLHGDSGRVLAFGPGWAPASAAPGQRGNMVFSGHRDTHFAWLQELRIGDELRVEHPGGERRYRISQVQVADSRRERLALEDDGSRLLLVTCWPFDAVRAGGPLRYVVSATPLEAPAATALSPPGPAPLALASARSPAHSLAR